MTDPLLTTVEIEPAGTARSSVIWMHGLGADANDFGPIVPEMRLPAELGIRFVFPNAPVRPVTINGGMRMRAWYDVLTMDLPRREDPDGVYDSERALVALVEREKQRGVPAERIVLAGFSQGGAMALHTGLRYPDRLAGILALSCYIPLADRLSAERRPANQHTPLFVAHGDYDAVIPMRYGQMSVQRLESLGYPSEWHDYGMGHEVCLEEIRDIAGWLARVLAVPTV
ncbi:MAG: alpha/beta fold hydrolase [Candidatus Competibacteraceae bacterium]|uniref:Phospholipase/Carboxylesterase n=1 Tax=Candidatus Contendobacter odensis Run_B_J11 TaxID=1400861 RepID=A0A7U7GEC6_9GAMM|nr:alpha/beta fold hydrolase [Candidatus Contendobacter odensis]MBK8537831.1 alpha/beta fold hydrolase [Candidatus Competibacteraceae bacterium]CDH46782.1 putative Phospholipase/Carboxylesterase [Candidatus Contendobacter odensis Run_B_J11]